YGNHWMLNAVTEKEGKPGAVLIRAAEPVAGFGLMKSRRKTKNAKNLTNGPGKLTQAFGITKRQNGTDLTDSDLYFTEGPEGKFSVVRTTRIGLAPGKGDKLKLRFYIKGNEFVSRK
ncbi:MAG: DNA-3-methyladenine glycosylase, partial [Candidatus Aenigmatarchaeota archaeon]